MTQAGRGKVSLKEKRQSNSRSWKHKMTNEKGWCWPRRNRITSWRKRVDPKAAVHNFAEDDEDEQVSGGLNHLVPLTAGEA